MGFALARSGPALAAGGWAVALLLLGGLATDLGPWYQALAQPAWKPPRFLFGPVWTLVLGMAALAAFFAWHAARDGAARTWIIGLFLLNGLFNVAWGVLFFVLRRPDWALVDLLILWLSIPALMVLCGRSSRRAAWCLLPYLIWVGFAGALNLSVVSLNGPFGAA